MIYNQDTIPISRIPDLRPTFRQFRERYGLSQFEVARQADVHVLFVYCMERGKLIEFAFALRLMDVLSHHAGYLVRIEQMQGIRLKNTELQNELFRLHKKERSIH